MFGLTHCRGIGTMSSFRTQLPFDSLPEWQRVRALPLDEQRRALARPRGARAAGAGRAQRRPTAEAIGGEARTPDFDRMQVLDAPVPPQPDRGRGGRGRAASTRSR